MLFTSPIARVARTLFAVTFFVLAANAGVVPASAAETTGIIVGRITDLAGHPVSQAAVVAGAASARYATTSDAAGRFILPSVTPDTYTFSVSANTYEASTLAGIVVFPGRRVDLTVALKPSLKTIASIDVKQRSGIVYGQTSDVYRISGDRSRGQGVDAASGLATYTRGTIQSAIAAAPGVQQDQYSNIIVRGGRVDQTAFTYDAVPVPQGLIAEPGGNVVGAQLPTTGIGYTSVSTAGFPSGADDALSAEVDQTPLTGTYPAQSTLTFGKGLYPNANDAEYQSRWATPDLRHRYAVDVTSGSQAIAYGDGRTFYPVEAATYGLSIQNRAVWSLSANAHFKLGSDADLELLALGGQAVYDQYGTPFAGETFAGAPVNTPSRIRGTYAVEKAQYLRNFRHSYMRARVYRSLYGSLTDAPFFDDLSFPNGVISYFGRQYQNLFGAGIDAKNIAGAHEIGYGIELRTNTSGLSQVVPTLDERVTSNPNLQYLIGYLSDRFSISRQLAIEPGLRFFNTSVKRSDGRQYAFSALDAHIASSYRWGADNAQALRLAYDHTTVPPAPLEVERNSSALANAPFTPLAPERGNAYEVSFEHQGRTSLRFTYFFKHEKNLIDVIPQNYRSPVAGISNPATAVGIPQSIGDLVVNGLELSLQRGGISLSATYTRGFSSSASQFGLNDLNAPAIAANHLFPIGYVPPFSALLSYELHAGRTIITPWISYESGYPYGNGKMAWVYDANGDPVQVANDNHVNPGYNYYFLRDPSLPFDANSNPYIANLGTPEGNDPNTLRSKPLLLVSLRAETPLSSRVTLMLDVANLFGNAQPTQMMGNPYLIGPPGYTGGNPLYARYYGTVFGSTGPYTLGNGIPTNDGTTAAVPWSYGTGPYIASSYPEARSVYVRIRVRL